MELLITTGQTLLENGAETFRVETSILNMYRALGNGEINVIALATQLTVTIADAGYYTATRRIRRRGVNLEKFARVNDVVRKVTEGQIHEKQARAVLYELESAKSGNKVLQIFATAVFVAGMYVFMVGGGVLEAAIALFSCLIVQTVWTFIKKSAPLIFISNILSGLLIALIAAAGTLIWGCEIERIMFGAMLPMYRTYVYGL